MGGLFSHLIFLLPHCTSSGAFGRAYLLPLKITDLEAEENEVGSLMWRAID